MDVEIIACPTVSDDNDLSLSSHNSRLSAQPYQLALHFPILVKQSLAVTEIISELFQLRIKVDYIEELEGRRFGAITVGDIRLIVNV